MSKEGCSVSVGLLGAGPGTPHTHPVSTGGFCAGFASAFCSACITQAFTAVEVSDPYLWLYLAAARSFTPV